MPRVQAAIRTVLGLALIGIVLVNVGNAAARYLLSMVVIGADEILVFAMIFMVVGGAVLALALRSHIALELLPARLTGRARLMLFVLHDLATLAILAFAVHASWLFVQRIAAVGPRSMALDLPMTIPHAALLAGLAAMMAIALIHLVRDLRAFAVAGWPAERKGRDG